LPRPGFDAIFTTDRPVIFASDDYPWLILQHLTGRARCSAGGGRGRPQAHSGGRGETTVSGRAQISVAGADPLRESEEPVRVVRGLDPRQPRVVLRVVRRLPVR